MPIEVLKSAANQVLELAIFARIIGVRFQLTAAGTVTDEKRGSYYPAMLTLSQNTMDVDGKRVPLSPGMNITAEIKTGQRRVIEFLLSPVQRAGSESLRER
jgi:hemolysin D